MLDRKQTITAFTTFAFLLVAFLVYERTLGTFTQFPQIEPELALQLDDENSPEGPIEGMRDESRIAAARGFGPRCAELDAPLRIDSRKKTGANIVSGRGIGLFVYAEEYEILPENPKRLRLRPFSLVQIKPSPSGNADEDEILTVRGNEAFLEFDGPIDLAKLTDVNPVAGWVAGKVSLKTNRRTKDPTDDIVVYTERLHYEESKNLIWSDDHIRLVDHENEISGVGMELELYAKDAKKADGKRSAEAKKIHLFRDVRMDLVLDASSNFLGPGAEEDGDAPPSDGPTPPRTPVAIVSDGKFEYDLEANQAIFRDDVQVTRTNPPKPPEKTGHIDRLICDRLVLDFRDRTEAEKAQATVGMSGNDASPERSEAPTRDLRLRAVLATGEQVILISRSQDLVATGNYLSYNADTRVAKLRDNRPDAEIVAKHGNTTIHARQLEIAQGSRKGIRTLVASGPDGWLEMLEEDGAKGSEKRELTIRFQDRLTLVKKAGSETELVVVTKNVELESKQAVELTCDELKVWLAPVKDSETSVATTGASAPPRRKLQPVRLEAKRNVSAHSDEFVIVTENLLMHIVQGKANAVRGAKAADAKTPEPATPPKKIQAAPVTGKAAGRSLPKLASKASPSRKGAAPSGKPGVKPPARLPPDGGAEPGPTGAKPKKRKRQPLDIRARQVVVNVERVGSKSRPVQAWAAGKVLVTQTPAHSDDRPIEIRGHELQFVRKPNGDVMKIDGSAQSEARILSTDFELVGRRQIVLNEEENFIQVSGAGLLITESESDLLGESIDQSQKVRIDWTKSMHFDGRLAQFRGDVVAQQQDAKILCERMDVTFSERIDFRESRGRAGRPRNRKSRIDVVDCDVVERVYDTKRDRNGKWDRKSAMGCAFLRYDNKHGAFEATGPGFVLIVEPNRAERNEAGRLVPPENRYQVTKIKYDGKMNANQRTKTVKFFDQIFILHTPTNDLEKDIDEDDLPPDGMTIRAADVAEMSERKANDGKSHRDFQAKGNVRVRARDYWGQSERLSYDKQKDLLVFDSDGDGEAHFYRRERVGAEATHMPAKSIMFYRATKKVRVNATEGFDWLEVGPDTERKLNR